MMLIKKLLMWQEDCFARVNANHLYKKLLIQFGILSAIILMSAVFYTQLMDTGLIQLIQNQRYLYFIALLYLLLFLKFLWFDFEFLKEQHHPDPKYKPFLASFEKQLKKMAHFTFLKKIDKNGDTIRLFDLPWIAIIGPKASGKTSLLAKTNIHYLLKPKLSTGKRRFLPLFWMTRENTLIELPGYFFNKNTKNWLYFLEKYQKIRGKNTLDGFFMTVPCSFFEPQESKKLQQFSEECQWHLLQARNILKKDIGSVLIITKCDLIPGFVEYFDDLSKEDSKKSWGIYLPHAHHGSIAQVFSDQFDQLIGRLNQQLITKLHHNINTESNPRIKDFPLEVQQLKKGLIEVVQRLSAAGINLRGVYLTSTHQYRQASIPNQTTEQKRALKILNMPLVTAKSYFTKELLLHAFAKKKPQPINFASTSSLVAFCSMVSIMLVTFVLSMDLTKSIYHANTLATELNSMPIFSQRAVTYSELFTQDVLFLDLLKKESLKSPSSKPLEKMTSFYSHKESHKSLAAYHYALQETLLPTIRNYFASFLKSADFNPDKAYEIFKAYVMLVDRKHFNANYILHAFNLITPANLENDVKLRFLNHLKTALLIWHPIPLEQTLAREWQTRFMSMPIFNLAKIILNHQGDHGKILKLDLNLGDETFFKLPDTYLTLKKMHTAEQFTTIIANDIKTAAEEAYFGNWFIGARKNTDATNLLNIIESLRVDYVNDYIETWENITKYIALTKIKNLSDVQKLLKEILRKDGTLQRLLQNIYVHTYFEPIVSSSKKLQSIGTLLDQRHPQHAFFNKTIEDLQTLKNNVDKILTSQEPKKLAFEFAAARMQNNNDQDTITALRQHAKKLPPPIRAWIENIADVTWHEVMKDAAKYIDLSWQNDVSKNYLATIAKRYPFAEESKLDVELENFSQFFGRPGTVIDFHDRYLQAFIDTNQRTWMWKTIDEESLPFTQVSLKSIQQALHIHKIFFPDDGNKPYVKFSLRPYRFSKEITNILLGLNDKSYLDKNENFMSHMLLWPQTQKTSFIITINNGTEIKHHYSGDWALFRFINQNYESALTRKGILLNLSKNEYAAHYILYATKEFNPFLAMSLRYFVLPATLYANT